MKTVGRLNTTILLLRPVDSAIDNQGMFAVEIRAILPVVYLITR